MLKKIFFLILMLVIFLASCRKDEPEIPTESLYLKLAGADEEKTVCLDGTARYLFFDDILFRRPALKNKVEIMNNPSLTVKDFKYISTNEIFSNVIKEDSQLIEVYANKLPFTEDDYGCQTEAGDTKFNGILRSKDFIFAVNVMPDKIKIKVFDLNTSKIVTNNIASVQNGALTFKVKDEILKIWLSKISPRGNIFQLYNMNKGGATDICYSLYLGI